MCKIKKNFITNIYETLKRSRNSETALARETQKQAQAIETAQPKNLETASAIETPQAQKRRQPLKHSNLVQKYKFLLCDDSFIYAIVTGVVCFVAQGLIFLMLSTRKRTDSLVLAV